MSYESGLCDQSVLRHCWHNLGTLRRSCWSVSMANIREKGPYQWAVQVRRKGWPIQNATFRTKKDALAWA